MLSPDAVLAAPRKKTPQKKHFHETRTAGADHPTHARGSQVAFARAARMADGLGRRRK